MLMNALAIMVVVMCVRTQLVHTSVLVQVATHYHPISVLVKVFSNNYVVLLLLVSMHLTITSIKVKASLPFHFQMLMNALVIMVVVMRVRTPLVHTCVPVQLATGYVPTNILVKV